MASKLVEMDIVKTPEVERIISEGEGFEEPTAPKKQQKRAVGTFDKWPGNRVPYLFHIDLGKYIIYCIDRQICEKETLITLLSLLSETKQ